MDSKELRGLYEAYAEVYAPQEELDEASRRDEFTRAAIARNSGKKGGITFEPGPNWDPSANRGKGAHLNPKQKEKQRRKALRQEELDIFDVVLEFLQAEGYAETLEEAEWMMANMIDEEAIDIILSEEQLDEISQKTATSAYAQSRSGEFEGADSERDIKRTDNLEKHIKRKFGDKAAKDADRHADSMTFGRKDPRTGKRQPSPKPRIEKNRTYRTTKSGKMHGQDQSKLKRDLEYKRSSRTEEFEFWVNALVEEGYDLSDYTWDEMYEFYLDEDSRRMSNKQHTARVRANIKSFGSNYTPPSNYDPDANRGQGEVVTRKQMEKKRRKALRQEDYVGEAQEARNNPEKYEREQAKKSAPVRGERTPMPPRGDKRREDFEKWYAKQMGR
jgi:hypothetical protein